MNRLVPGLALTKPLTLMMLVGLALISLVLARQAFGRTALETKSLERHLEPVVVSGKKVPLMIDVPVDHLFLYTYSSPSIPVQVPFQLDEVAADGSYVNFEDGVLDANDQIVMMVKDLGDRIPVTASLTTTLPISAAMYEIEVADPLSPTRKGWAYLVRSGVLAPTFSGDYVEYVTATQSITTSYYELGFATTGGVTPFFGLHHLALNGSGVDILDRSKLRVSGSASIFGFPVTFSFTEQNLDNPETALIKDGPVRALIRQTGDASIAGQQEMIYAAYAQLLHGTANVNFDVSGVTVSEVRTSMDLVSTAPPANFYSAYTSGDLVDGVPDSVNSTPFSSWTQISHSTGRFVQVGNPAPAGGTAKTFYRDDSTPEPNDTGETGSYGDSGFLVEGNLNSAFTIQSSLFVLPANDGESDNVGASYAEFSSNPLTIATRFIGGNPVFLPLVTKK